MLTCYEVPPNCKAAMDVAVRADADVQHLAKGHRYTLGGRLPLAYLFERPVAHAPEQEKNK
jgi:hypothetical protein